MKYCVYKYVLNDEIIYIGKTSNLEQRIYNHGKVGDNISELGWNDINNAVVYYADVANQTMADVIESELIRRYKPKYNKAKMSEWNGLNFVEPIWKKYIKQANTKIPRETLDKQAEYVKNNYKQIKLAIPKAEAEAVSQYCKHNGIKVATLIRNLIKEEIKSSINNGIGNIAKTMI